MDIRDGAPQRRLASSCPPPLPPTLTLAPTLKTSPIQQIRHAGTQAQSTGRRLAFWGEGGLQAACLAPALLLELIYTLR